uniref:Polynucleotide adenylyltransferase n=1 Tax=Globodera pallida TaxID=36090 RepID=A0A183BPR2_GLOPA
MSVLWNVEKFLQPETRQEEESPLDRRLKKFVQTRKEQESAPTTSSATAPIVLVAASVTEAVQTSPQLLDIIEQPLPKMRPEEEPKSWFNQLFLIDKVKLSEKKRTELNEALEELIFSHLPSPRERDLKMEVVARMKQILRWGWGAFDVIMVGSTQSGTDLQGGDLDIVLKLRSGERLSEDRKGREFEFLHREFKRCKRDFPTTSCAYIRRTKTPLIKMTTSRGTRVDLTIDNLESIKNTAWIEQQASDERFWKLYMACKIWTREQRIGDASMGGLNSLAWAIMVRHFLTSRKRKEDEECQMHDFLRFTEYYRGFPYQSQSITQAGIRRREPLEPIFIEDPHNPEDNCARNRRSEDVGRIQRRCAEVERKLLEMGERVNLSDLGFSVQQQVRSQQQEIDEEQNSAHSDFDERELVFEQAQEGETMRRVTQFPSLDSYRRADIGTNGNAMQPGSAAPTGRADLSIRVPGDSRREPQHHTGHLQASSTYREDSSLQQGSSTNARGRAMSTWHTRSKKQ